MTLACAAVTAGLSTVAHADDAATIDRYALVSRHNIMVRGPDPFGAMAVGNGHFAFNFDITGLQTFPEYYHKTTPVGILSDWGWHNFPNPNHYTLDDYPMKTVAKHDRTFVYPGASTSKPSPAAAWLRTNENRIGLGQIGLVMTHADGSPVKIEDLHDVTQYLNLWTGLVTSNFTIDGVPVHVSTAAAATRDEVAVSVRSTLITNGQIKLKLAFPYASTSFGPDYQDWTHPEAHTTTMKMRGAVDADFSRTMDDLQYTTQTHWSPGLTLTQSGPHTYVLTGGDDEMQFTAAFSKSSHIPKADTIDVVEADSRKGWYDFWTKGAVIDFSGTADPRAAELERRIVLSQYVMAVHDANNYPGQETGLAANSWFGKFHMEMYFWHAAYWALWGHPELLERSLSHLNELMPAGQKMAKLEGCKGVKWSKMTDPTGVESPSGVGPVLVWQQPHPIFLAELAYRATKDRATLEKFKDVVFQTADYMATFVDWDASRKEFVLGPGVSSGDEKHTDVEHNLNPTMEVGYWKWTLQIAQQWRVRLGMKPNEQWQNVIDHLAKPIVRDGVYPALEFPVETRPAFMATWLFGVMPDTGIDQEAIRKTLHGAAHINGPENSITWGTGMAAMCATRLGEVDTALQLMVGAFDQNPFRVNGYTFRRPDQTPMYMPANGAWLDSVALMAAGWDGHTSHAPGFPKEWTVRYEGILPLP